MPEDLEVLVHISAPVSKKSDNDQSRLAQASVGFPATNRIQLASISTRWRENNSVREHTPSVEVIPNPNGSSSRRTELPLASNNKSSPNLDDYYIESDTEAAAALESQLLTSSINGSFDSQIEDPAKISQARPLLEKGPRSTPNEPHNDDYTSSQESVIASTLASVAPSTTSQSPKTFADLPLFAVPPSVPVGIASPSTSLFSPSEILTRIRTQLPSHYRPTFQTRKVSRKERGAWILITEKWSEELQIEFFAVLSRFIRSGVCGYGVSAYRIAPVDPPSHASFSQDAAENSYDGRVAWEDRALGTVQVFCFGETVREVYLLMWIISASKIRMATAFWVDAKGKTIIKTG